MNKKNIGLILLLLLTTVVWSQTYSISGEVRDEHGEPMSFVNVYLSMINEGEQEGIKGSTTEDNGTFIIEDIDKGNYSLLASFLGFKTHKEAILVDKDIELEIILFEEAEALSEVEIIVKRPTLRREVDRLVFNVANTSLSEGNVMDVLHNTPGVLVLDNNITIKNSAPTVYINDRKIHLTSDEIIELLEGTSASTIKSVELITNPSARYDAESGVVLNIIMTKNLIAGYSGSIFSNYTQGVFPRANLGTSNFYKSSKFSIFANYSYNYKKIDRINEERVDYLIPNGNLSERWLSNIDRNTWSETHNISTNIDYDLNNNNRISFSTNLLFLPYFKYIVRNNTNINDAQNNNLLGFDSNNLSRDNKKNLGFDLNYTHDFKKDGASLTVNSHFTTYDYMRKQSVNSNYFDTQNSLIESTAFNSKADQDTQILTSQIDYKLPIGETASFETGIKGSNIKTKSAVVQYDIINDQEVLNVNNSDGFDYNEDVYGAYINFDKNWDKWSFSAGLRTEHTDIVGKSDDNSEANKQNYLEWFPSINLSHQISEGTSIYGNYKRSIQRPNYNLLNPFKFFLNDNTIVAGNPNLQPVFIDHSVLGTSFNDNFFVEVYYKSYKDNYFEIPIQDNTTNVITYSQVNLELTKELGFDFLSYFNIGENWFVSALTSFYYTKDKGVFDTSTIEQDLWANYSSLSNNITFLKDKTLSLNFALVYSSRNLQGLQFVDKGQLFSDLSIKKTIFKGKGILSLAASDLFKTQDYFVTTKFLNQNSSIYSKLDSRYIRFGFRYKLGNTALTTNEKELTKEERDRLQSDRN